ncbi:hypothetical protein [Trinickia sp.]|uniref:hypothetical protein n=1 Tax=Trinickia sp. TaxID=2571163 RepID=UPI003F7E2BC9
MNPSSERVVVFVTPAQKRVLAARAARMGISLSELVRRAVLAFDETGEEVRAAGLVDRLGAQSRTSDSDVLRRLAAGQVGRAGETDPDGRFTSAPGSDRGPAPVRAGGEANAPSSSTMERQIPEGDGHSAALPVAAAVARALASQAQAQERSDDSPDPDDEALVARVIANESRDLSGF